MSLDYFRKPFYGPTHVIIHVDEIYEFLQKRYPVGSVIKKITLPRTKTIIEKKPPLKKETVAKKDIDITIEQKLFDIFKNIDINKLSNSKTKIVKSGTKYSGNEINRIKHQLQTVERERNPRSNFFKGNKKADIIDEIITYYNNWRNIKE